MPDLLIAGCGALGNHLGTVMSEAGWRVYGLRRDAAAVAPGLTPLAVDLARRELLPALPAVDAVVYTVTPSQRAAQSYQQAYIDCFENLYAALPRPPQRLIYVSSSGVLADQQGAWVDESSADFAASGTARILRAAEVQALRRQAVILRLAGIYGPDRRWLLRRAADPDLRCAIDPPQWTNRIHAYDCVMALRHLLLLPVAEGIYHGVDDCPVPRYEVLAWLRQQLELPPPGEPDHAPPAVGGKRVSNRRLRAAGWAPRYADYRAGYGEMLAASR